MCVEGALHPRRTFIGLEIYGEPTSVLSQIFKCVDMSKCVDDVSTCRNVLSQISKFSVSTCRRSVAKLAAEKNRRATPRNRIASEKVGHV